MMGTNIIWCTFRRLATSKQVGSISRGFVQTCAVQNNNISSVVCNNKSSSVIPHSDVSVKFIPRTLNIDFGLPRNNAGIKSIIDLPIIKSPYIEDPFRDIPIKHDIPASIPSIDLPANVDVVEKRAISMLRIRRHKMKKHKLKKLRDRMAPLWTKRKQKREALREKGFQIAEVSKIIAAQRFNPEQYVMERLKILKTQRLPKVWKGSVILPELAKQLLDEIEVRKEMKRNWPRLK